MNPITFNKPYMTGKETEYIRQSVESKKISGDGIFTKKCHHFFEEKYNFKKCLLTTSCTDALEMTALLINLQEGDEVIMPSYTFVSTSNAFVLRGAKIIFADSEKDTPNIDADKIEELITTKTKAIVVVHYAGMACDMDKIMAIADKHELFVIEDAAQAVDSFYNGKPLGSIGHLAAFSFHETKNIISGEGGMLVINDDRFIKRAEIIREKGTNRSAFFRGEIDKYGWVDIGSSFLPSDIIAAFLYAQLENLEDIQNRRKDIWNKYYEGLKKLDEEKSVNLPKIPKYATNNAHMFYLVCNTIEERSALISKLKENDINAVFHYLSLHKSPFYTDKHDGRELPSCDKYANCLVRLPFYYELEEKEIEKVINTISEFYA
ncbi:dTDP-4-amino-4,6-dideoxygalactose transaminase [Bernardetia sp. ABR2-2B]|uniref:dTDP-4-amino-4,6-dideoxygalactose transaminase n=1 Tax=Bernardetia sp. ABR2-2B TaxID=3127472 RepID=UPI0030D42A77